MSGRTTGNARESIVADDLDARGYGVVSVKGSGSRGAKMRRRSHAVIGDLLALPAGCEQLPWLQIECGTHTPGAAFRELRANALPGFTPFFVQYFRARRRGAKAKKATRRYYVDEHRWFADLDLALEALRDR